MLNTVYCVLHGWESKVRIVTNLKLCVSREVSNVMSFLHCFWATPAQSSSFPEDFLVNSTSENRQEMRIHSLLYIYLVATT